jgi:hypothetical protein
MPQVHGLEIADFQDLSRDLMPGAFQIGNIIVEPVDDNLAWGVGRIQNLNSHPSDVRRLAAVAVSSLQEVDKTEEGRSSCTDGRYPLFLGSNRLTPVRSQLVGASMATGWFMAEAIGDRFFEDPTAPIEDRISQTAEHMVERGVYPCTHEDCGARGNHTAIQQNAVKFANGDSDVAAAYRARNKAYMGEKYNPDTDHKVITYLARRVEDPGYGYDNYAPDVAWRAVMDVTGQEGTYNLLIDRRGLHGHLEKLILRLQNVGRLALNTRLLAELTGGDQVFGVNDDQLDILAKVIGGDDEEAVRIARHAGEHFTNAGHATLGKYLPSYRAYGLN